MWVGWFHLVHYGAVNLLVVFALVRMILITKSFINQKKSSPYISGGDSVKDLLDDLYDG